VGIQRHKRRRTDFAAGLIFMMDYSLKPTFKEKVKKRLGMKVRTHYKKIPLLSEAEIREKYKENDWGFLVAYVKQHRKELDISNKKNLVEKKLGKNGCYITYKNLPPKSENDYKNCPYHKVKLINISRGAGWTGSQFFPQHSRICPICGFRFLQWG
jgi:hypothetical protein